MSLEYSFSNRIFATCHDVHLVVKINI